MTHSFKDYKTNAYGNVVTKLDNSKYKVSGMIVLEDLEEFWSVIVDADEVDEVSMYTLMDDYFVNGKK